MIESLTVPLVTLATELGRDPDKLAASLGDDVLLDGIGFRVVEAATARRLLDQHRAAQAELRRRTRERRERIRAHTEAASTQMRERLQALREHDSLLLEADPSMDAFAVMCGGEHTARMEVSGTRMDSWLRGESTAGRFSPGRQ